jgi:hypothetical protein
MTLVFLSFAGAELRETSSVDELGRTTAGFGLLVAFELGAWGHRKPSMASAFQGDDAEP